MKRIIITVLFLNLLCYSLVFSQDYTVSVQANGPAGILVKYSGDYEGISEAPVLIGPYPEPYTVYLEPTTLEIQKDSGMGYYLAGFQGTYNDELVSAAECTNLQPQLNKIITYLDYDDPPPSPAPTVVPVPTTGMRGYIKGLIKDKDTQMPIEGAAVKIYDPNNATLAFDLTTSIDGLYDSGYFGDPSQMKSTEWYIEVDKDGYFTGGKYQYCWTCSATIEIVPITGQSPEPLPSYSPTPPAYPTSMPPDKALWKPVSLVTRPDIELTKDDEILVSYFFQTPCVRVVDWGTPLVSGNTITIDPFFAYYDGSNFKPNNYIIHSYKIEGITAGTDYTFVFKSWDNSYFSQNVYMSTPAPTPADFDFHTNPVLSLDILTSKGQTTARVKFLFFETNERDIMYNVIGKGPVTLTGNTFVLSPEIIKAYERTSDKIVQSSFDYSLGELTPGIYNIEVYSQENLLLAESFSIIDPSQTPAPSEFIISGHVDGSTILFLYGSDYRIIKPDTNGNFIIENLSPDGYYEIQPIYIPVLPETVFLTPENNEIINGYKEFALQVSPDVIDCEYSPMKLTYDGVYSNLMDQNFSITGSSDIKKIINRVNFYIDGMLVSTDNTYAYDIFTYLFYYDTTLLANGFHTLKAEIFLSANETTEKQIIFQVTEGLEFILGDANRDHTVNIIDALLTAQYYVGLNPSNFHAIEADVNCNGSVNIVDALLIAQYYVGSISSFPCDNG